MCRAFIQDKLPPNSYILSVEGKMTTIVEYLAITTYYLYDNCLCLTERFQSQETDEIYMTLIPQVAHVSQDRILSQLYLQHHVASQGTIQSTFSLTLTSMRGNDAKLCGGRVDQNMVSKSHCDFATDFSLIFTNHFILDLSLDSMRDQNNNSMAFPPCS